LRACCIPLPVMGFAAFPESDSRSATWQARPWREGRHLPRDAIHTPRRHPRLQPHHVTVAVAPLPLAADPLDPPSCRRCQRHSYEFCLIGASTSRLFSAVESGHLTTVSSRAAPCLPWALFPFEVPPGRTQALMPCIRGAADDENPKKTVRISDKLRSAPAASVRCKPTPGLLAKHECRG
jgi:hypothetical protein